MKSFAVCLIGLLTSVSVASAVAPTVSGQVRLLDGSAVAGAQVLLFDLGDLRRGPVAQATADAAGQFARSLGTGLPQGFALGQNYPNPFNPGTVIPYRLAAAGYVRLEVFNLLGQWVATLVDGERSAGAHTALWTATDASGRAVSAGVYVYRLTVAGMSQTGRMVLVDGQAGVPQGGARVEARPVREAQGSSYGLVVLGAGLVAYVDADFRVVAGPVAIELAAAEGVRGRRQGGSGDGHRHQGVTPPRGRQGVPAHRGPLAADTLRRDAPRRPAGKGPASDGGPVSVQELPGAV